MNFSELDQVLAFLEKNNIKNTENDNNNMKQQQHISLSIVNNNNNEIIQKTNIMTKKRGRPSKLNENINHNDIQNCKEYEEINNVHHKLKSEEHNKNVVPEKKKYKYLYKYDNEEQYHEKENENNTHFQSNLFLWKSMIQLFFSLLLRQKKSEHFISLYPNHNYHNEDYCNNNDNGYQIFMKRYIRRAKERYILQLKHITGNCNELKNYPLNIKEIIKQGSKVWESLGDHLKKKYTMIK